MEELDTEQPAHKKPSETEVMHAVLGCGGVWSSAAAACKPSEAFGGAATLQHKEDKPEEN